ncbi:LAMI_0B06656g1_1 [Lachancea mirantina]|uniref:Ubiquinone biosynthesis O-methyltransferase, mitochondrial n=1 Tax=Lachancea mirantina TaxID=1230905 RepID=A0A1G4IX55_9SACH|nr:LAMI_0B06656g1_1 [Lachancea mirantina]
MINLWVNGGRIAAWVGRSAFRSFIRQQSSGASSTASSAEEILHFGQLAPTWWDVRGPQRILHKMNLVRMDFVREVVLSQLKVGSETFIPGYNYHDMVSKPISQAIEKQISQDLQAKLSEKRLELLDVGCGGGIFAECAARLPYVSKVLGIDVTPECVEVAKAHSKLDPQLKDKLEYKMESLEKVPGQYDIVTCFEMLEHVDEPAAILRHAWQKVKPDGILVLSTINRGPLSWFTTIFVAENLLGLVPRGTHHLDKYINSAEISQWFQDEYPAAHKLLECKGTMYIPAKGWILHDQTDVGNYFMAFKKLA